MIRWAKGAIIDSCKLTPTCSEKLLPAIRMNSSSYFRARGFLRKKPALHKRVVPSGAAGLQGIYEPSTCSPLLSGLHSCPGRGRSRAMAARARNPSSREWRRYRLISLPPTDKGPWRPYDVSGCPALPCMTRGS